MLSFSLPQIWLYEKLKLIHHPLIPFNQYQPKHYWDLKLKDKEMEPATFTEILKYLTLVDVQWVVEWWHIKAMASYGLRKIASS